jgi:hypothetical protein
MKERAVHNPTKCSICCYSVTPVLFHLTWSCTTIISDSHYATPMLTLKCDQPYRLPQLELPPMDRIQSELRAAYRIRIEHTTFLVDFGGLKIILKTKTQPTHTILSHSARRHLYQLVEYRLQDYGIFASVYDLSVLTAVPSPTQEHIYSYMPRTCLTNQTLIVGVQHERTFIVTLRVTAARFWNKQEVLMFAKNKNENAVTPFCRPVQTIIAADAPQQPLLPNPFSMWHLPHMNRYVHDFLLQGKDYRGPDRQASLPASG